MRIALVSTDNREHFKTYDRPAPDIPTPQEALLQGFAEMPELEIHYVSCLQQPANFPEKIGANIRYHGLHVPKWGWMRSGYQGCIRAVRRKLREIAPDIVHGQGTERDCSISAVFSGFPNVLTIHGNMRRIAAVNRARPFSFFWLAARLEALTVPRSDGVVCLTQHTRAAVAALARRTWVLPNAADKSFFDIDATPAPDAPPVILCVATVCALKNQINFIRALDPLAGKTPFKLVFLGQSARGNPYVEEFLQMVAARPWCSFGGYASREELKKYLQDAAFLVLPSLEDNCPMNVLEGMAAGVPVVAARVGGVPDLIEDGRTGLLCDPHDQASMRSAVAKLLDQPGLSRKIAVEAKRCAFERFHPLPVARRHVEIYTEVLKTRS